MRKKFKDLDIQVDGGIGIENIETVAKAGANVIVSGSGIVKQSDPFKIMSTMRESVNAYI